MFLMIEVHCKCGCSYRVANDISTRSVTCPNCDSTSKDSVKIIEMLTIANSIEVEKVLPQYVSISRKEADALA